MSGTRAISTTSRRELSSSFCFLPSKAPKEIHAILTETLAFFLPGRAKELSAHLQLLMLSDLFRGSVDQKQNVNKEQNERNVSNGGQGKYV